MDITAIVGITMAAIAILGIAYDMGKESGKTEAFRVMVEGVKTELKVSIKAEVDRNNAIVSGITRDTENNAKTTLDLSQRLARVETEVKGTQNDFEDLWPRLRTVESQCVKVQTICEECDGRGQRHCGEESK